MILEVKAADGLIHDFYDPGTESGIIEYNGNQVMKYRMKNRKIIHYEITPETAQTVIDIILTNGKEVENVYTDKK